MNYKSWVMRMAFLFGLVHLVLVTILFVTNPGNGEGLAFALLLIDLPLMILIDVFPGAIQRLLNHSVSFLYFAILGSLMYAAVGALLGMLMNALRK